VSGTEFFFLVDLLFVDIFLLEDDLSTDVGQRDVMKSSFVLFQGAFFFMAFPFPPTRPFTRYVEHHRDRAASRPFFI